MKSSKQKAFLLLNFRHLQYMHVSTYMHIKKPVISKTILYTYVYRIHITSITTGLGHLDYLDHLGQDQNESDLDILTYIFDLDLKYSGIMCIENCNLIFMKRSNKGVTNMFEGCD